MAGTLAKALGALLLALPCSATKNILYVSLVPSALEEQKSVVQTYEGTTWSLVAEFSLTPSFLTSPTGFLLLLSQALK